MNDIEETILDESTTKTKKASNKKNTLKKLECNILSFDSTNNILDFSFNGYGLRVYGVDTAPLGNKVTIKYSGTIGSPNFTLSL